MRQVPPRSWCLCTLVYGSRNVMLTIGPQVVERTGYENRITCRDVQVELGHIPEQVHSRYVAVCPRIDPTERWIFPFDQEDAQERQGCEERNTPGLTTTTRS